MLVELTPKLRNAAAAIADDVYGAGESSSFFDGYSIEQLELLLDFSRRGRSWTEERVARARALPRNRKARKTER